MRTGSDAGLNRSVSTLVCLANNHPEADKDYNIPFCVATLDRLDQNEDTTYQLIGFNNTCQRPEYKLHGYLTPKYVSTFATACWPKIGNSQFRDVELIPCSELGIEEEFNDLEGTYVTGFYVVMLSAFLFMERMEKLAKITLALGTTLGLTLTFLDLVVNKYINEKRRERIHDLLSGN